MPSKRLVIFFVRAKIKIKMLTTIKIIVSMNNSGATLIGVNAEDAPKINKILKMLEPTALPRAIPDSCFFAAVIEVTSSGREVPIATMVRPIRVSLKPKLLAIIEALSTTKLPPQMIAARPITIKMILFGTESSFSSLSAMRFLSAFLMIMNK